MGTATAGGRHDASDGQASHHEIADIEPAAMHDLHQTGGMRRIGQLLSSAVSAVGRIAPELLLAVMVNTASVGPADAATVQKLESIPKTGLVCMDSRGDVLGVQDQSGNKSYMHFRDPAEMLKEGIIHIGLAPVAKDGPRMVTFGAYLDGDIKGPLNVVIALNQPKARQELIETGRTGRAETVYEDQERIIVPTGREGVWGPHILVPENRLTVADASGDRSLIIRPDSLKAIEPVVFVDGRDVRRGNIPLDVLEKMHQDESRQMNVAHQRRTEQISRQSREMRWWIQRGWGTAPHMNTRFMNQWELELRRRRELAVDLEARRRLQMEETAFNTARQRANMGHQKAEESARMMDDFVQPVGIVPANRVSKADGRYVMDESNLHWTTMVKGDPNLVGELIRRNVKPADLDAITSALSRGEAIQAHITDESTNRIVKPAVTPANSTGGVYVLDVNRAHQNARLERGILTVDSMSMSGPYQIVFGEDVAPTLDGFLHGRYYNGVEGQVPSSHVLSTMHRIADADGDGLVTAAEMGDLLKRFGSSSVIRTMSALSAEAKDVKPAKIISTPQELGRGGGFMLMASVDLGKNAGSVGLSAEWGGGRFNVKRGGPIRVYGSYAEAFMMHEALEKQGIESNIVGSALVEN